MNNILGPGNSVRGRVNRYQSNLSNVGAHEETVVQDTRERVSGGRPKDRDSASHRVRSKSQIKREKNATDEANETFAKSMKQSGEFAAKKHLAQQHRNAQMNVSHQRNAKVSAPLADDVAAVADDEEDSDVKAMRLQLANLIASKAAQMAAAKSSSTLAAVKAFREAARKRKVNDSVYGDGGEGDFTADELNAHKQSAAKVRGESNVLPGYDGPHLRAILESLRIATEHLSNHEVEALFLGVKEAAVATRNKFGPPTDDISANASVAGWAGRHHRDTMENILGRKYTDQNNTPIYFHGPAGVRKVSGYSY
jgi:hypothetical protein